MTTSNGKIVRTALFFVVVICTALGLWPISLAAVAYLIISARQRLSRRCASLINLSAMKEVSAWRNIICLGIPIAVGCTGLAILFDVAIAAYLPEWARQWHKAMGPEFDSLFAVSAVAVAPLAEELLFRGFLFNALLNRFGVRAAALIAAIPFGLLHADILGATFFGISMALLTHRTKSLVPAIVVHFLNNVLCVAVVMLLKERDVATGIESTSSLNVESLLVIVGLLAIGLPAFYVLWRRDDREGSSNLHQGIAVPVSNLNLRP